MSGIPYLYLCLQQCSVKNSSSSVYDIYLAIQLGCCEAQYYVFPFSPSCVTVFLHMLGTVILNMCIKSRKYPSYCACADELPLVVRALSAHCSWPAKEAAAEDNFCTTCFLDQSKKRPVVWLKCWGPLSPLLWQDCPYADPGEAAAATSTNPSTQKACSVRGEGLSGACCQTRCPEGLRRALQLYI